MMRATVKCDTHDLHRADNSGILPPLEGRRPSSKTWERCDGPQCGHRNVTGFFEEWTGRHLRSTCDDCGYTVTWPDA